MKFNAPNLADNNLSIAVSSVGIIATALSAINHLHLKKHHHYTMFGCAVAASAILYHLAMSTPGKKFLLSVRAAMFANQSHVTKSLPVAKEDNRYTLQMENFEAEDFSTRGAKPSA